MQGSLADKKLDSIFGALADSTRRAILARLAKGEASVLDLAAPFNISQPAVTKHLNVLENAGLIVRTRDGQRRLSQIQGKPLEEASDWLEKYRDFWEANYQRLDLLLAEMETAQKDKKKPKKGKK